MPRPPAPRLLPAPPPAPGGHRRAPPAFEHPRYNRFLLHRARGIWGPAKAVVLYRPGRRSGLLGAERCTHSRTHHAVSRIKHYFLHPFCASPRCAAAFDGSVPIKRFIHSSKTIVPGSFLTPPHPPHPSPVRSMSLILCPSRPPSPPSLPLTLAASSARMARTSSRCGADTPVRSSTVLYPVRSHSLHR